MNLFLRLLPSRFWLFRLFRLFIRILTAPVNTLRDARTIVVRGGGFRRSKQFFVPWAFIHRRILTLGGFTMKVLILFTALIFINVGCSSTPVHKPYNYGYALSELHRAGNPNSPPTQAVGQGYSSHVMASQTCTSYPIFNFYGEFVRYHVECR